VFYDVAKAIAGAFARRVYKPVVTGTENIPASGPVVAASNHLGIFDSVFFPVSIDRKVHFLGKQEYFSGPGVKGRVVRWFMNGVGVIPVDRSGGRNADASIKAGVEVLRRGELVCIYPEGTRSPDGRLYKGKTGVARLALEGGATVVPVAMSGLHEANPPGTFLPRRGVDIACRIGEPIDLSPWAGRSGDSDVLREVTDLIMSRIAELSDQVHVPTVYAASVKKRLEREARDA
jgi:1-acyl-sn-glycerol-3-phosphate acyltransferase